MQPDFLFLSTGVQASFPKVMHLLHRKLDYKQSAILKCPALIKHNVYANMLYHKRKYISCNGVSKFIITNKNLNYLSFVICIIDMWSNKNDKLNFLNENTS